MSTSLFAPVTLNGVSQYSSDLQNIQNRAVAIAQIPVTALQNHDSDVLNKEAELSSLGSAANNLAASLQALGTVSSSQALSATSSDDTVVTVTNSGSTTPATYTINSVTSAASAASERSLNSYADSAATAVSTTGKMLLTVGTTSYPITLTNNNLVTLRDTINGLGAGVTASILTTSSGNYLSISANTTGATTLSLVDDPGDSTHANTPVLTSTNQGTDAVFQLNGINIHQSGNVINNVVPGVSFTIQGASTNPVTLSLQTDPNQLSSALQDFVTNYNAMRTALNGEEGPAAGPLSGDTSVLQLEGLMRQVAGYTTSTGSVNSLAALGIEFDSTGQASFNQTTFSALDGNEIADGFKFLGSATSGFGGFSQSLTEIGDPVTGLIKTEQTGLSNTDRDLQTQISTLTDRINTMQTNLAAQLEKADASIAMLQNQQTTLSASLQGLNLVLYGKSPGSS